MATLRDIRNRIKAVKNTQKITRAMKMVAAARLRKAQENIINARPYAEKINNLLLSFSSDLNENISPLFKAKENPKKALIVVLSSDKGLCGSFNLNIVRSAISFADTLKLNGIETVVFCPIGKKSKDFLKYRHRQILDYNNGFYLKITPLNSDAFANFLIKLFLNGDYDQIYLAYNKFKTVMTQTPSIEQFLPIAFDSMQKRDSQYIDYIYEPDSRSIALKLIERAIKNKIWTALLESYASELGARMTAMDLATENAKELLRILQIKFNKERQAAITKEILEVVSGANALKEKQ